MTRIHHQELVDTKEEVVKNTAMETFAYTKAILVKPWLAASQLVTREREREITPIQP